ncbi:MAG: glutamate--cysteine ligase [Clostridiaceae bacterium]|nr:glutamate--cysteine ligase [Clostridiaceae bacterium]
MDYEKQIDRIAAFIKSGEKSEQQCMLGAEFEHIIVKKDSFETVNYYEENGIENILKKLASKGYKPKYEGQYVVGLEGENDAITLEPGGQFEISIEPCSTIKQIEGYYLDFLKKITPILEEQDQLLMAIGYHPKTSIKDIPFNPKERYKYMAQYLGTKGEYAHNMMKGTASLQVVIDYKDQEDFKKKFKVANFLSPLFHLITDNAPVFEGEIYENHSIRSVIWENTDSERSGIVPGSIEKDFGYREYAEYVLNTPPILVVREGEFIGTGDKKAKDLIDVNSTTDEEIDHILSMVFPDVRVRQYMEIRMGDILPYPLSFGYIALIKGIFYNDVALKYLYEMAKDSEEQQVVQAKSNMVKKGFLGTFKCKHIRDFIPILFDLARKGLNEEEKLYLKSLEELIFKYQNPAIASKKNIEEIGLEALKWCSVNQYGKENAHGPCR